MVCLIIRPKKSEEEDEFRLQYIRGGLMKTPEISVLQAQKEIVLFGEKMQKMYELLKEAYHAPDEEFAKLYDRIDKYEDLSDRMEAEIGKYLGDVGQAHLSDETKGEIRAMLRQIGELESVGDSFFNLVRILKRKRDNKVEFSDAQIAGGMEMVQLLEDALTQMNLVLASPRGAVGLGKSAYIEARINDCRNRLKQENIDALDQHLYGYDNGTVFMDLIGECEKSGDYIINVVEARVGESHDK